MSGVPHNDDVAPSDSSGTALGGSPAPAAGAARLAELRGTIDNLDAAIVHLLAERFKCTQQVGRLKARHGMPPADPAREAGGVASEQGAGGNDAGRDARREAAHY
jgi:chorismate mutase